MSRFVQALNRFLKGDDVVPAASANRAVNGNSGWLDSEQYHQVTLTLDVTVDAFTTLDVIVETASDNAGANARTVGAFAQKAGVSTERKTFPGLDRFYRVAWTITGGNGTFSVSGEAK